MNEELIKRIDGWLFANAPEGAGTILKDCRAEIERLSKPPSLDALIAEIDGIDCWCEGNDLHLTCNYDDVMKILGKYRWPK